MSETSINSLLGFHDTPKPKVSGHWKFSTLILPVTGTVMVWPPITDTHLHLGVGGIQIVEIGFGVIGRTDHEVLGNLEMETQFASEALALGGSGKIVGIRKLVAGVIDIADLARPESSRPGC